MTTSPRRTDVNCYACESLTKHCSVAATTVVLRNEILEFSHQSWYEHCRKSISHVETIAAYIRNMVSLVIMFVHNICRSSKYFQPFRDVEYLYVQKRKSFESFLESQLPKYYPSPALIHLITSLPTPIRLPEIYDDK